MVNVLSFALMSTAFADSIAPKHNYMLALTEDYSESPTFDDVDAITESTKQAILALTAIGKSGQSEARKQIDAGLFENDALRFEIQKARASLVDRQTKRLENQASKDEEFARASREHRDRMRDALLDLLRKLSEISDGQLSRAVLTESSKTRNEVSNVVDLINKNDRTALSSFLKRNVPVTNLAIVESGADNGATLKFSVGSLVTCFSAKQNCNRKTHSVTVTPNFVLPRSELSSELELAMNSLNAAEELMKSIEDIRESADEYRRKLKAAEEANRQALENLARVAKLLTELRAHINVI